MSLDSDICTRYERDFDTLPPNSTYAFAYNEINDGDTVLEIGCATGYWGKYTKKHKDVEIVGLDYLDYHVEKSKSTNCYSEVIQCDLNNIDNSLDRFKGYFDKIVILDVLEHLYNTHAVMQWLSGVLKDDGEIIISIPNVGHKSIIHQLLLGQFNYTQYGLLDKTHIRFFTLDSFTRLISRLNLKIKSVIVIKIDRSEYESLLPKEITEYINGLQRVNDFEYVYTIRKK